MKTETKSEAIAVFPRKVAVALSRLRTRLEEAYEEKYPGLGEIVRLVLDEEEAQAWQLSPFPHLLLPDLVEAHIARLGLELPDTPPYHLFTPAPGPELALAGAC